MEWRRLFWFGEEEAWVFYRCQQGERTSWLLLSLSGLSDFHPAFESLVFFLMRTVESWLKLPLVAATGLVPIGAEFLPGYSLRELKLIKKQTKQYSSFKRTTVRQSP